jgi:hypothetical protein
LSFTQIPFKEIKLLQNLYAFFLAQSGQGREK